MRKNKNKAKLSRNCDSTMKADIVGAWSETLDINAYNWQSELKHVNNIKVNIPSNEVRLKWYTGYSSVSANDTMSTHPEDLYRRVSSLLNLTDEFQSTSDDEDNNDEI
ncbi:hypothetical protein MVEG_04216 [Podila verticillata NRRL 6337]|nr:hypothetical protein MVEG_04216 [Podila verticillata NRRL 6337]